MLLALLAQANRNPNFPPPDAAGGGMAALFGLCCQGLIFLIFVVPAVAGLWKLFEKAGKPGWAAIVPIYNLIIMLEITGKPIWWIAMFFIPCVNIVFSFLLSIALAKSFGKSEGYGIGIALLGFVFLPLLGFSDARYEGPVP